MAQNAWASQASVQSGSGTGKSEAIYFKTALCRFHIRDACTKGLDCPFAHSSADLKPRPDLRRTRMCRKLMKDGVCGDYSCKFAHRHDQIRWNVTAEQPEDEPHRGYRRIGRRSQAYQKGELEAQQLPQGAPIGNRAPWPGSKAEGLDANVFPIVGDGGLSWSRIASQVYFAQPAAPRLLASKAPLPSAQANVEATSAPKASLQQLIAQWPLPADEPQ
mmetsp:Transcript_43391/g.125216  ORF Transcript_43391/g.125216 Transcript_43391/m.125216 type:complete len:218 (-) Transcript_43391:261-914(-)